MGHHHDDHRASDIHAAIILVIAIIACALLWNAGDMRLSGTGTNIVTHFEHLSPGPGMPPF